MYTSEEVGCWSTEGGVGKSKGAYYPGIDDC